MKHRNWLTIARVRLDDEGDMHVSFDSGIRARLAPDDPKHGALLAILGTIRERAANGRGQGRVIGKWVGEPPFASAWSEKMRLLLGKTVNVTIDREKPVVVTGTLLSFNEGGEVAIRHDDGFVTWAWPALEAEESDERR